MHSGKNIFELQSPQAYVCQVWSYFASHSMLLIRMDKNEFDTEVLYLVFEGAEYFEGPLSWIGADFYENPNKFPILRQRGIKNVSPDDPLLENFHLYVVDLPDFSSVKILAGNAAKSDSVPPDFSWLIKPI